jgi:hypothetical protein
MTEHHKEFDSIQQDAPVQLSAKELHAQRFNPRLQKNQKKTPLRPQISKPPPNSVKLRSTEIPTHFVWALVLAISCFFTIGSLWALYKTFTLRRMIQREEIDAATRLSNRIQTVLIFTTVIGIILWIAILFCTVGLLITGKLLVANLV